MTGVQTCALPIWARSSVDRAPDLHSGCRRFESCRVHHFTEDWQSGLTQDFAKVSVGNGPVVRIHYPPPLYGVIAQLIERFNGIEEAESLNLSGSTNFTRTWYTGCAAASKTALSGFDSYRPCQFLLRPRLLAARQSDFHSENQGSIPCGGATFTWTRSSIGRASDS